MSDIKAYIRELHVEALSLRKQVESIYRSRGLDVSGCGIYKLLGIILEDLDTGRITPERLRGNDFGLFRIVTDGWILEDEIGEDVLDFGLKLRKLADMLERNE